MDSFLRLFAKVPSDKLEWVPQAGVRSALNQYQEVATGITTFWGLYENRVMAMTPESFGAWQLLQGQLTTTEALEAHLRADIAKLVAFIRSASDADLSVPVSIPMPGEFLVVDTFNYPQ